VRVRPATAATLLILNDLEGTPKLFRLNDLELGADNKRLRVWQSDCSYRAISLHALLQTACIWSYVSCYVSVSTCADNRILSSVRRFGLFRGVFDRFHAFKCFVLSILTNFLSFERNYLQFLRKFGNESARLSVLRLIANCCITYAVSL